MRILIETGYICKKYAAMTDLIISVNPQLDGYNFGLSPKVRRELSGLFPNALLVGHLFVSYETKWDFEALRDRIEEHILPFLTGVELKELAKYFKRVVFFNPATHSEEHTISLEAYVEENQLVSR